MAFHMVGGPDSRLLGKLLDPREAEVLILPYLVEEENFVTTSIFNSKNWPIDPSGVGTQGHLFLTNLRILFWPDGSPKPTVGIELKLIDEFQVQWMPMKLRALTISTSQGPVMFASSKRGIEEIEARLKN